MLNFAVGPVASDEETLALGKMQTPYFRTEEFSALMKENESLMLSLCDAKKNSRAIFLTGSGTASMEAAVMNFFSENDRVLLVNGGSFGERFSDLLKIHEVPFLEIKLEAGEALTEEALLRYEGENLTGFVLQLCETSTGVLYDIDLVSDFCKKKNLFLLVDAISGFLADYVSMKKNKIDALITGSQKALALPPGVSIIAMSQEAVRRCEKSNVKSLYFNLSLALKDGERGQTPFTPAVAILLQLHEKLLRIEKNGGYAFQKKVIEERAKYFRSKIKNLPLDFFVAEKDRSNCVTAIFSKNQNAEKIFETLKDEYGIWVCPNGGELRKKIFRVGHIGAISKSDTDRLLLALNDMNKKGPAVRRRNFSTN